MTVPEPAVTYPAPIDIDDLMDKIAVQRPYFAFDSLYRNSSVPGWDIWGDFRPEQPLGHEEGPLAVAEAGRHLAILGTCAAFLAQPVDERIYYLASHAVWTSSKSRPDVQPQSTLTARARVVARFQIKKHDRVRVETELLFGSEVIGALTVTYQVLPERTFEKCFKNHFTIQSPTVTSSPYRQGLLTKTVSSKPHAIMLRSTDFSAAQCPGHFSHYPMWPVAVVAYGLTQALSQLLDKRLKRGFSFRVQEARLSAYTLVPASEPLSFRAGLKFLSRNKRSARISCCAYLGTEAIARLEARIAIELQVKTARKPTPKKKPKKGERWR